jgi:nitrogen fixation protein FixH
MSHASSAFVLRGSHVLAIVVGFFAVVVAIDVSFAVLAYRTDPGQVVEKPYEAGLAFNADIARREHERSLGWRAKVTTELGPVGSRRLVVAVSDAAEAPVARLKLAGDLARPATAAGHRRVVFVETHPGRYEASGPDVPGVWDLTIRNEAAGAAPFEAQARLAWR